MTKIGTMYQWDVDQGMEGTVVLTTCDSYVQEYGPSPAAGYRYQTSSSSKRYVMATIVMVLRTTGQK